MNTSHKVTIRNTEVQEKPWDIDGRSGVSRKQKATVECEEFRKPILINLKDRQPYSAGEYTIDYLASLSVTDAGQIVQHKDGIVLVPIKK
jgi:hypothetical protein